MSRISPLQTAAYAHAAGFRGTTLAVAVAVAIGESSLVTDARGDTTITTEKWGPSVGLWQVRSLNAERGTGGTRDADALTDPAHNARSAFTISGGGLRWSPWTVYTSGAYRQHLPAGEQARRQLDSVPGDARAQLTAGLVLPPVTGVLPTVPGSPAARELLDGPLTWAADRENWRRVGIGAAGVVAALLGAALLIRDLIPSPGALVGAVTESL